MVEKINFTSKYFNVKCFIVLRFRVIIVVQWNCDGFVRIANYTMCSNTIFYWTANCCSVTVSNINKKLPDNRCVFIFMLVQLNSLLFASLLHGPIHIYLHYFILYHLFYKTHEGLRQGNESIRQIKYCWMCFLCFWKLKHLLYSRFRWYIAAIASPFYR